MGADEEGTLSALNSHLKDLIEPCIAEHQGRVVKTTGDGILVEFASVVDAVRCAIAFQEGMTVRSAGTPEDQRITFRVGVNLGDVIVQNDDLFGDGVNIAARLEGLAEPGRVVVSGMVHEIAWSKIDYSFDDLGPQRVKNISDPVRALSIRIASDGDQELSQELDEAPALPDKPSIAVLPFDNMSADPEQEYFSDGIAEDIITELSKISGLFVIARHSAFTYKGKSVTLKQVGRELGVRFVLEGSVRKAGNRLRITSQLINAETDHHLWAERYDRGIEDIFAVQDEVARKVAEALQVHLTPSESKLLGQARTDNLEAYEIYQHARKTPFPPTRTNIRRAQTAYQKVIEIDPTFVGGYAGKSMMHSMAILFSRSDDPDDDKKKAFEIARQAIELDPVFALSHCAMGFAYSAAGQHEEALVATRKAVELQPGDAASRHLYSRCLRQAGLVNECLVEARTAVRLDPKFVEGPYLPNLARAAFLAECYEECMEAYERNAARSGPSYIGAWVVWAAACGLAGHIEKARELVREIMRERPNMCLDNIPDVRPGIVTDIELKRLQDGLRKAGLPE